MNEENELDDLFKKRLEDPVDNESYNEADWDALEQKLDRRKKRRGFVFWLPVYGSVAALLLLFLGYMVLRSKPGNDKPGKKPEAIVSHTASPGTNSPAAQQQKDQAVKAPNQVEIAKNVKSGKNRGDSQPVSRLSADESLYTANLSPVKPDSNSQSNARSVETLTAQGTSYILGSAYIAEQPVYNIALPASKVDAGTPGAKKTNVIKRTNSYRPQLAISVIAAPDINGVGSFQQSKVGTNEGLLFSAGLSRKFTISTGAIYSVKPYITGFENYHTQFQFPTDPINVTADCRMLDVPLNIGYQVFNKHQNSISVGTGLSSYIMLHQSFTFNYANTLYAGPAQYTVPKSDGYYFGILNLNATFQHQVNSKVGFTVQPYVKLPLTNIGFSQVRLQTTGVALGLTWNLNRR